MPLPTLIKAESGCPPEDCGGVDGFIEYCQAWHDANHPEHDMALEIFGQSGPGALDLPALQRAVQNLQ